MQKRNILNSPRLSELKKRRRKAFWFKILFFAFFLCIFFVFSVYISRLSKININEIQVLGNKVLDVDKIKKVVQEQINGKYLWLFPKTNIFYYPKNVIEKELQNNFKRLDNISFSIKDRKVLEVSVNERIASYTWCGVVVPTSDNNQKCYFMDADGYIFDDAPYFSPGVYFKFYGNSDGLNFESPSGVYFQKEKFSKIVELKNNLESLKLNPTSFSVDPQGRGYFYLGNSEPSFGPEIKIQMDSDFEKIFENLQAAVTTEPLKSKIKNNLSSIIYIDLRFENKVYPKFK